MKIQNFVLEGTNNLQFDLKNFTGKKLIIYFYPKDSTPGCTNEGIDFSANIEAFKKLNCEIFGISRDSIKSHENFKAKYDFKFELLSDPEEVACNIFDVIKMKNMYDLQSSTRPGPHFFTSSIFDVEKLMKAREIVLR